jgi:hypothetical protein
LVTLLKRKRLNKRVTKEYLRRNVNASEKT